MFSGSCWWLAVGQCLETLVIWSHLYVTDAECQWLLEEGGAGTYLLFV